MGANDWEANTSTVLEPTKDNQQEVMDLARSSKVVDEKCYLSSALFNVQVKKVEATKIWAEEDEFPWDVAAELHFSENDGNHSLLNEFEVGEGQMAYREGLANAGDEEEDREVLVYPGVVGLACAEGEETGVLLQFVE
jgi:hypothetical protein